MVVEFSKNMLRLGRTECSLPCMALAGAHCAVEVRFDTSNLRFGAAKAGPPIKAYELMHRGESSKSIILQ